MAVPFPRQSKPGCIQRLDFGQHPKDGFSTFTNTRGIRNLRTTDITGKTEKGIDQGNELQNRSCLRVRTEGRRISFRGHVLINAGLP
jgi:hypothetical protein